MTTERTQPTPEPETVHAFLRRETAGWHRVVEHAFAGLDLRSRPGLAAFLTAQASAVLAIEAALDRSGVDHVCGDWAQRRRGALLRADLDLLGCRLPSPAAPLRLDTPDRCLGALYVLEGSRLGGKLIARRVRESADPLARRATRFLEHEPAPQAWRQFRDLLERAAVDRQHLLDGAIAAFACFRDAAGTLAKLNQNGHEALG